MYVLGERMYVRAQQKRGVGEEKTLWETTHTCHYSH